MMVEQAKPTGEFPLLKFLFIFLLKLELVISTDNRTMENNNRNNHSCYTCVEPLVGYSKHFVFEIIIIDGLFC